MIVGDVLIAQSGHPQDQVGAVGRTHGLRKVVPGPSRVGVVVDDAALGREQRAISVGLDRTALGHEITNHEWHANLFGNSPCHEGIALVGLPGYPIR